MSYGTLDSVLVRLGRNGVLNASTTPTSDQAGEIHRGIGAEIDHALTISGLSVPVTTSASFVNYLAAVEAWGTAAEILKTRFQDVNGPNSESSWKFYQDKYAAALKDIKAGLGIDEAAGATTLPGSYFLRNPQEHEDLGAIAEPAVTIGQAF